MTVGIIEVVVLTIINSGAIFLITILLANSSKDSLFRWLTIMTVSIVGWVNFAYLGYNEPNPTLAVVFYRVNLAFVSLFFFAEYMLYINAFAKVTTSYIKATIFVISAVFLCLSLFTDTLIQDVTRQYWGNEIVFGPANDMFNMFAMVLNIWIIFVLFHRFSKLRTEEKKKTRYFLWGTFLFLFLNITFNVVTPVLLGTARYQHFGDYSAVLFLIFTAYAVVSRKFMNVKIALTAFVIGAIGMLIVVDILALSRNLVEQGMKSIILIFFSVLSVLLVRSVLREIQQKEQLEKTNKALDESTHELEEATEKLKNMNKQLREVDKQKDEFVSIASHELRTPMTAIKGYLWLALKKNKDKMDPTLQHQLEVSYDSTERLIRLVNDMLTISRIERRKLEIHMAPIDLAEILQAVHDELEITADQNGVKFTVSLPKQPVTIEGDKDKLREVIQNLVGNALKFTQKGYVKMTCETTDQKVKVSVEDTGPGILKEDMDRLFAKFAKLEHSYENQQNIQGTGLGLYISKKIVTLHGGDIDVQSEVNKGTTFTVTLPVRQKKE